MIKSGSVLLTILLVLGVTTRLAQADSLHLVTEENPPYNTLVHGRISGLATEKTIELMRRANMAYELELLPWARAYMMASNLPKTCVFSTTRTMERESKFRWVGPLGINQWILYGKADRHIHLQTLEDARPYLIGTYTSDVGDTFFRERGYRVDAAPDDDLNPKKLLANRIDLWVSSPFKAQTVLVAENAQETIVPVLTFNKAELYLACNLAMPERTVARLNRILGEMQKDGTSAAIEQRYGFGTRSN
ncbi:substrate-binding periplasmic protein [Leeia oryzae]|uniref:substrate-binding periplasmic protein n=1 Tax=Leeia oryzae TaxID=356662 RepID=UPI00037D66A1|nr:ABC transporter substrate-binding protein [Leeia oryzae]